MSIKPSLFKKTIMRLVFLILFLNVYTFSYAKIWTISNNNLEVKFNDENNLITVKDKRINKMWAQKVLDEKLKTLRTIQQGNKLSIKMSGEFDFTTVLELNALSALEISISADKNTDMTELNFPAAFNAPDKNHYLLETDGEGLLLPLTDTRYPLGKSMTYFCGGGLAMGWMGITDTPFKSGYMAILETPFDAGMETKKENGLITFSPIWVASKGKFAYDRKVVYHFFDKGGYVAQCKTYRDYIWKKNRVLTLKQNALKTPAISKMVGAVHIYVWDNARNIDFVSELKQSGIEKAMILWNPNHTPYPKRGFDTKLKELGYAEGLYELFTDLKLRDTAFYGLDPNRPLKFALTVYPGKFNELAIKGKGGKSISNQFGHTSNPITIRTEMMKRMDREFEDYNFETYFLDVYTANGLFENYTENNPLTRAQYAEAVIKNHQIITDKYHQFIGGEWGADYIGSNMVYNHGMMTLQRTWFGSEINKEKSIYYLGNWRNNERPSIMLGSRIAPDTYLEFSINEYTRVPLYDLVYHDAIVSSWRWEDANHHTPEIWWKKDLFNILYGNAPLWSIDKDRWDAYKNTFIESYKNVCPWLQQIGYDEMISHRFVTTNHQVQETVFSSGKRAVVNFGDTAYNFEGKVIKPRGFITL